MTKDAPPNRPADPKPTPEHLYSQVDPIPVPEAVESFTDTAWGLWEDLIAPKPSQEETSFAATEPADLLPDLPFTPPPKRET